MARVMVTLYQDEREALITLAQQERRDPRQQAALCIRHELERRGLLPADAEREAGVVAGEVDAGQ